MKGLQDKSISRLVLGSLLLVVSWVCWGSLVICISSCSQLYAEMSRKRQCLVIAGAGASVGMWVRVCLSARDATSVAHLADRMCWSMVGCLPTTFAQRTLTFRFGDHQHNSSLFISTRTRHLSLLGSVAQILGFSWVICVSKA